MEGKDGFQTQEDTHVAKLDPEEGERIAREAEEYRKKNAKKEGNK